ncbi:MAG: deoxyribonuclease IV [Chlamydiota bacterium]
MQKDKNILIGAHTSTAGGLHNALLEGQAIGATTVQLFTRNQKRWEGKELEEEEVALFKKTLKETGLSHIMSHDSYLINLGCPDAINLAKSRKAFAEELIRCHKLDISYLNFHPGAALKESEEACLKTIVKSLEEITDLAAKGNTRLLIEATAGQGSCVGYTFEQLGYIVRHLEKKIPIGVCIDTCHIFAAGYDIRTKKTLEDTLLLFDQIVGLKHLYAFHLNDSLKPLGSKVDRHASLGKGEIGMECFHHLMQHPLLAHMPKYLETPEGPPVWKEEIQLLKHFSNS